MMRGMPSTLDSLGSKVCECVCARVPVRFLAFVSIRLVDIHGLLRCPQHCSGWMFGSRDGSVI